MDESGDFGSSYVKKNVRSKNTAVIGIQEPKRTTLYDIVCYNFDLIGRTTFIHRFIYAGFHNCGETAQAECLIARFSDIVNQTNRTNNIHENLTGFLVVTPKYFIHMIEGDEEAIYYHLKLLLGATDYQELLNNVKVFTLLTHVNRRLINDWGYYCGLPPQLFTNLVADKDEIYRITLACVLKLYSLSNFVATDPLFSTISAKSDTKVLQKLPERQEEKVPPSSSDVTLEETNPGFQYILSPGSGRKTSTALAETLISYLPEDEMVSYILTSDWPMNIEEYFKIAREVPQIYRDFTWPVPEDFIPFDVFDTTYDRITTLPKPDADKKTKSESTEIYVGEAEELGDLLEAIQIENNEIK
ncbi:uncharacterized protein [Diabrotica undecimpunctata]|uniref:uncharacterized protein n=1 Tax=Diabrotica undecimpunctata TaxID=50387 RepID=UPI003B63697E